MQQNIILTPHQQAVFEQLKGFLAGGAGMATLEGYAGTGKTTLVGKLVGQAQGMSIAIAAPTNKAVAVLAGKIGDQGYPVHAASIHSLLGLRMREDEDGTQHCEQVGTSTLHEYALVVIDECSMVSAELFGLILKNRRYTKVLFVGDPAQLQPVKDEQLSPVFRLVNARFTLTEVVRQASDNPIIRLSMVIRQAIEEQRRVSIAELVAALPTTPPCKAGVMSGGFANAADMAKVELQNGSDCRIVASQNKTVKSYNRVLHCEMYGRTEAEFSEGEAVIANEEFRGRELPEPGVPAGKPVRVTNSEILAVRKIEPKCAPGFPDTQAFFLTLERESGDELTCYFPIEWDAHERAIKDLWSQYRAMKQAATEVSKTNTKEFYRLNKEASNLSARAGALKHAFAPLRHTYAMTAHKSQGSTFHTVIGACQ